MNDYALVIAAANTATLVTGGLVLTYAYRAFRRTGAAPLRSLAVGFAFIVAGSLLGGLAHLVGGVAVGVVLQSTLTAVGFAALCYSLFAVEPETTTVRTEVTK